MATVTISMPESLRQFLDHEVETKGYGNVSEYMRCLLRDARAKEADARLEALLLEGLVSGDPIPSTPEFWRELRSEVRKNRTARNIKRKARAVK